MAKLSGNLKVRLVPAVDEWPVIWRVVAPACGSYDHDMDFIETESEREARACFRATRDGDWPVRLERVQCGPLPASAKKGLTRVRGSNAQNPGTSIRAIAGYWEVAHG